MYAPASSVQGFLIFAVAIDRPSRLESLMIMLSKVASLTIFVFFILLGGLSGPVFAVVDWDGEGSNDLWSTQANWENDTVPNISDTAHIDLTDVVCLIDSTVAAVCSSLRVGYDNTGGPSYLNITGGSLTLTNGFLLGQNNTDSEGIVNISGGSVFVRHSHIGGHGNGTLTISGGTLTHTIADMFIPKFSDGVGHVQLDGGIIYAPDVEMRNSGGIGTMDITEGTLIIDGDKESKVNGWATNTWLTAYGGSGSLLVDYDITHGGKTTVKAEEPSNLRPIIVDAGRPQWAQLTEATVTVSLDGNYSDDSETVTTLWAVTCQPEGSTVVFAPNDGNPQESPALNPTATFDFPGDYVLRLTANDAELQGTDEVIIYVCLDFGIVAQYSFEDNLLDSASAGTGPDDLTAFLHEGSVSPEYPLGIVGQAVRISGDEGATGASMLYVVDSNDIMLPAFYTMEAFIKPDVETLLEQQNIVKLWGNLGYSLVIDSGDLTFYHNQELNGRVSLGGIPLWCQWQHIAITADGENINMYVNGVPEVSHAYDGTLDYCATEWPFDLNYTEGYAGLIDEFLLHNEPRDLAYMQTRASLLSSIADLAYDRVVNLKDFQKLADNWLNEETPGQCYGTGDFNHDCQVDLDDLRLMVEDWLINYTN